MIREMERRFIGGTGQRSSTSLHMRVITAAGWMLHSVIGARKGRRVGDLGMTRRLKVPKRRVVTTENK